MACTKHSFLRELREVAPEMELFREYYSPCEKYFVTKLLYLQSFQLAILQNYLYLKEYDRKVTRHIFLTEILSETLLYNVMHHSREQVKGKKPSK